jgi:hypothetical protein
MPHPCRRAAPGDSGKRGTQPSDGGNTPAGVLPAGFGQPGRSEDRPAAGNCEHKKYQENDEKYEKQDLGNPSRGRGDAGKTEYGRDD